MHSSTESKAERSNRLAKEVSPYLLQHANNPVDWYPWCEDAFEKARQEDKPVFLSVGYSTCHWCHVMERESFEDSDVAELLNRSFVPIKVDREERPDVDHLYMQATHAMTGAGGWPMSVFMTPERVPFFAGTYFPRDSVGGRPGFVDLLRQISMLWRDDRERIAGVASQVLQGLQGMTATAEPGLDSIGDLPDMGVSWLGHQYDPEYGGFGSAPKFPSPHTLSFLLRWNYRHREGDAVAMVENTLRHMRRGGIWDHVGFGIHRYSTDRQWLLPHFEKMLYDQAMFLIANIEAWQVTGGAEFRQAACETAEYVMRDMRDSGGGFYSAEDADSEGCEGKFYVWTPGEICEVLGEEGGRLYCDVFTIEEGGNFREQATGEYTGESIPHLRKELHEIAHDLGMSRDDLTGRLELLRQRLHEVRGCRIRPMLDDKILTGWNGLMIAGLAMVGRVIGEESYREAARGAASFVLRELRDSDGALLRRYRMGQAGLRGVLEDYAYLIWGLIELYEADFDVHWLREAVTLTDRMLEDFRDSEHGGLFLTAAGSEELLVRSKEVYDGAIPSGNSVAAMNLVRLSRLTGRSEYESQAREIVRAFCEQVRNVPAGHTQLLSVIECLGGGSREIVIAGEADAEDTQAMLEVARQAYHPCQVVLFKPGGPGGELEELIPWIRDYKAENGGAAWVCENFRCHEPVRSVEQLRELLTSEK